MKVLVTGGAGFIGSNLALALEKRRDHVIVIDDFSSGHFKNLIGFSGDVIARNLVDCPLEQLVSDVDVIFHQASITDTTITDQYRMIHANVEGFRNVLRFSEKKNVRLIYASSAGVYGDGKTPMREDQVLNPLNSYAFSKCVMDQLAKNAIERQTVPLLVGLRYFNVFGPREEYKGKSASMIYQLAQQMKQDKRPRIFSDGEQKRDHIYMKDVVEANLSALRTKNSGIFNVGAGTATSFNRLVEILNEVLGTRLKPDYFENPYAAAYQDETLADPQKAKSLLGFKTNYSIEAGIRDYLFDTLVVQ